MINYDMSAINQFFSDYVRPKEMAEILDDTLYQYAILALHDSESAQKSIAEDLLYLKMLRDAISKTDSE